ncbi:unnamed protein product [Sphacelaria rigidula]
MATTKEVSTDDMLAEKLRLMEVKQAVLIEAATQKAKRDAIAEHERDREKSLDFDNTGPQGNHVHTTTAVNRDRLSNPGVFHETRQGDYILGQRTNTNSVRFHNNNSIPPWDGSLKAGESLESKFRVFHLEMWAYFRREKCYDSLFSQVPIRVFHQSEGELKRQHGCEAVDEAQRAWDIILEKITAPQIVEHLAILGSPSEAWDYFLRYYGVCPTVEKARYEREWNDLEMSVGESPLVFFSRANFIRHKRHQYGVVISEFDANRHYARRLSSDYLIQKSMLLAMPEIDTATLESMIKIAHAELELSRSRVGSRKNHAPADAVHGASHSDASVGRRGSGGGRRRINQDACCTDNHHHNHNSDPQFMNSKDISRSHHQSHHQCRECCSDRGGGHISDQRSATSSPPPRYRGSSQPNHSPKHHSQPTPSSPPLQYRNSSHQTSSCNSRHSSECYDGDVDFHARSDWRMNDDPRQGKRDFRRPEQRCPHHGGNHPSRDYSSSSSHGHANFVQRSGDSVTDDDFVSRDGNTFDHAGFAHSLQLPPPHHSYHQQHPPQYYAYYQQPSFQYHQLPPRAYYYYPHYPVPSHDPYQQHHQPAAPPGSSSPPADASTSGHPQLLMALSMSQGESRFRLGQVDLRRYDVLRSGTASSRGDSTEKWIAGTGASHHITGNTTSQGTWMTFSTYDPLLEASRT